MFTVKLTTLLVATLLFSTGCASKPAVSSVQGKPVAPLGMNGGCVDHKVTTVREPTYTVGGQIRGSHERQVGTCPACESGELNKCKACLTSHEHCNPA